MSYRCYGHFNERKNKLTPARKLRLMEKNPLASMTISNCASCSNSSCFALYKDPLSIGQNAASSMFLISCLFWKISRLHFDEYLLGRCVVVELYLKGAAVGRIYQKKQITSDQYKSCEEPWEIESKNITTVQMIFPINEQISCT